MRTLFIRFLSSLPFWALYILSDLLVFIIYHVVGYRKKVVMSNLAKSFPDSTEAQRSKIAKDFYKNLCDLLVETIKGLSVSKESLLDRVAVKGGEHLMKALAEGHSVMALTSHLCNWEWMLLTLAAHTGGPTVAVYQKLKDPWGEELMKSIRTRFGSKAVDRGKIIRQMVAWRKEPKLYGMVADQSPKANENVPYYWKMFMNQETVFQRGPAVLAPKLQMAVMYLRMERLSRGRYQITIQPMRYPPFDSTKEDTSILSDYARYLEEDLQRQPANWLWSHKRWKQQRPKGVPIHG